MKELVCYVTGALSMLCILTLTGPNCPTEDSCKYSWENGHARVVEDRP